jgi:hypothetical protein
VSSESARSDPSDETDDDDEEFLEPINEEEEFDEEDSIGSEDQTPEFVPPIVRVTSPSNLTSNVLLLTFKDKTDWKEDRASLASTENLQEEGSESDTTFYSVASRFEFY